VSGWLPPGELIPWAQVKSVHMTHILKSDGDYVHEVIVGRKGMPTMEIAVSGLPNGIFLPCLIAFTAARQGVMVTGTTRQAAASPPKGARRT
jgi:hypothetical protein